MKESEQTVLAIKGIIFDLSADDQNEILGYADELRAAMKKGGEKYTLAAALVMAETQQKLGG